MIIRKCRTKGALEVIPEKNIVLDLEKIKNNFETLSAIQILVLIKIGNYIITCYKNGKLLIRNCLDEKEAEKIADKIFQTQK